MYISSKRTLEYITTSKMERFPKIADVFQPIIIFAKRSILDVWHGSEYVFELHYEVHNTAQKAQQNASLFFTLTSEK